MWGYAPQGKNLSEFKNSTKIEELRFTQAKFTSLKGIEVLTNLKKLEISSIRTLTSIEELEFLKNSLHKLEIHSCKKIESFDVIQHLKDLMNLKITDCGELASIKFIEGLENLKSFVFSGTNILDGDISVCKGIEYIYFTEKKYYSHRRKDFNIQ
ncbi:hypothetical protein [Metabacillus fastidiosus]|uniref:hypothetical protein n=1 Tax=Metabacillus fastidiosus TaxID=1458 RepID=UPI003D2B2C03